MYYADSDFLTIILALITFAAAIYSSGKKKGKGKLSGKVMEKNLIDEQEIDEQEDLFDTLFGIKKEEEREGEALQEFDEAVVEEELYEGEEVLEEQSKLEREYAEALERMQQIGEEGVSVINSVEGGDVKEADGKDENKLFGIKERIRKSPKDMILFAEILKPKFKEF